MNPRPSRLLAATAAACLLAIGLPFTAHADAGLEARDDAVHSYGRGPVVVDVLVNDSYDPAANPVVDSAVVLSAAANIGSRNPLGDVGLAFSLPNSVIADPRIAVDHGRVTVDFGPLEVPDSHTRKAVIRVTVSDDYGQRASSVLTVTESGARADLVTEADEPSHLIEVGIGNSWLFGPADPVETPAVAIRNPGAQGGSLVLRNDRLPLLDDVRFEVVEQPATGRVLPDTDLGYSPGAEIYFAPSRATIDATTFARDGRVEHGPITAESFTYRLCETDGVGCSNVSRVNFDYRLSRGLAAYVAVADVALSRSSPDTFEIDLTEVAAYASGSDEYKSGLDRALDEASSIRPNDDASPFVSHLGGGRYQVTPRALSDLQDQSLAWVARDASGEILATVVVNVRARLQPRFALADDALWVAVGGTGSEPVFSNDPSLDRLTEARRGLLERTWIGERGQLVSVPSVAATRLVDAPTLGEAALDGDLNFSPLAENRFRYRAGSTPGVDTVRYEVCDASPVAYECSRATVRVHVAPLPSAVDDYRTVEPGSVIVPILDNDVFTDIPGGPGRPAFPARVTLGEIPEGVEATLNADRTVTVNVPESARNQEIAIPYSVADFTATPSDAAILLNVSPAVGVPDPGPVATDDAVTVNPEAPPVGVSVLSNDSVGIDPRVSVGDVPDGLTVSLDGNTVNVRASEELAGQTVAFPYSVADADGTASATVYVTVTEPVVEEPVAPDAVDDEVILKPGAPPLSVRVLANDFHGAEPRVTLPLAEAARNAGMSVTVDDGEVLMAADATLAATTLTEPYVLTDASGLSDQANIVVTVLPLDEPEPEPLSPPDAVDDATEVLPGAVRTVRLLANDTWDGKADVSLIERSIPEGLTVDLSPRGRVEVAAADSLEGRTVTFRYRLTDASGLSDVATVTVEVGGSLIVVTGAERSLPEAAASGPLAQAAGAATSPVVMATGGLLSLLGALLLVVARRQSEASR